MSQKKIKTLGWILTIIIGLLFALSAFLKLTQNEAALSQASSMGISAENYLIIGVVELVSLVLFIIPRTGIIGGLLLIAYMGGAIASHLGHQQPVAMAVIIQVLLWITIALRFPEVLQRLFHARQNQMKRPTKKILKKFLMTQE